MWMKSHLHNERMDTKPHFEKEAYGLHSTIKMDSFPWMNDNVIYTQLETSV